MGALVDISYGRGGFGSWWFCWVQHIGIQRVFLGQPIGNFEYHPFQTEDLGVAHWN